MSNENTSIEAARAELERCDRAMQTIDRAVDHAQAVLNRLRVEYNAAIDKQLAARRALAAAMANEASK